MSHRLLLTDAEIDKLLKAVTVPGVDTDEKRRHFTEALPQEIEESIRRVRKCSSAQ
jgi:hypothetical protein